MSDVLKFTFRYVNQHGHLVGRTLKGAFDGLTLQLGEEPIATSQIVRADRRWDRLILTGLNVEQQPSTVVLAITSGRVPRLQSWINQAVSARMAHQRQSLLAAQGQGHTVSVETCPKCYATVDLSGLPRSEQTYCPYCNVLWSRTDQPPPDETKYRLCDACGFFAQPREYTIFYFFGHGIHWQKKYKCHSCMRPDAWKMLAFNSIFILGVVPATVHLWRAYRGGSARSRDFVGLESANSYAKKRNADRACEYYDEIESRLPRCAGVRYNHGLACLLADRLEDATIHFQKALMDCANYAPAYERLCECYTKLGHTDALEQLHVIWGRSDVAAQALSEE